MFSILIEARAFHNFSEIFRLYFLLLEKQYNKYEITYLYNIYFVVPVSEAYV